MTLRPHLLNRVLTAVNKRPYQRFMAATRQIEAAQRAQLTALLTALAGTAYSRKHHLTAATSYEQLRDRLPVTGYGDWQDAVVAQMRAGAPELSPGCKRYQPTSGSTAASKWIPYSPRLLAEFDSAAGAWLYDAALRAPRLRRGRHYWSLSWLPDDQRQAGKSTNDQDLLPWWKALPLAWMAASPAAVSLARTSDDAMYATIAHLLAASDLTLMSVWSPTFALTLFNLMAQQRQELAQVLAKGAWGGRQANLSRVPAPKNAAAAARLRAWDGELNAGVIGAFWPHLAFVSAWDSASSKPWAKVLRELVALAYFQGKGLWATEGVVTIPVAGQWPLALTSHFYEFRDLSTQELLPAWRLEVGMQVQPVLSTGSGFWRYELQDRMAVIGRLHDAPCLEFLGRLAGTDLVGEKIDVAAAQLLVEGLSRSFGVTCLSLFADANTGQKPRYVLLAAGDEALAASLAEAAEAELCRHFHYRLARQLGQLGAAAACVKPNAMAIYVEARRSRGILPGDIKVEPLLLGPFTGRINSASDEGRG